MNHSISPIREFLSPDDDVVRRDVFPSGQPAVLRGLVRHWPIVQASENSPTALLDTLRHLDNGTPVDAIMTPPEVEGRVFYNDAMTGFNFIRNRLPIGAIAEQLTRYATFKTPPAVAVQSALIRDCLPGFSTQNRLTVIDNDAVLPRIWLGNSITTPTHLDEWNNIGCVVAGRRRFTLFPPEQIANLYIGPLDFAPTGAPMSLVQLHAPDFDRFPRFREALDAAVTAELEAGDAIYIPPLWWHHVQSLEPFNLLVNYWWHALPGTPMHAESGFDSLIHAVLNLRSLPPPTRNAWRALFEHYVFGSEAEVVSHIPSHKHGVLGRLSPADREKVKEYLAGRLKR